MLSGYGAIATYINYLNIRKDVCQCAAFKYFVHNANWYKIYRGCDYTRDKSGSKLTSGHQTLSDLLNYFPKEFYPFWDTFLIFCVEIKFQGGVRV